MKQKNIISYLATFAKILLGKLLNDEIVLDFNHGVKKAKIISIEKRL